MTARPPLIDEDDEIREITEEDFLEFRPLREIHPHLAAFSEARKAGRPKSASPKREVKLRIDADTLEAFKATGKGWQTRMNQALREWIKNPH